MESQRRVSVLQPPSDQQSVDRRRSSQMPSFNQDLAKRRQSQAVPGFGVNARRKQSIWRGSISETSATTPQGQVKAVLENTYRTDPLDKERFKACEVATVIKAVLRRFLQDVKYDPTHSAKMCKDVSQQLTHEIKELGYTRHKIISHVIIAENKDQGFNVASRCLWNHTTDSYATAEYHNAHVFAVGMVHGVYFE